TEVAPGSDCAGGGYLVQTGLDDGDGGETANDGNLGAGEVESESYACNGVDGYTVLTVLTSDPLGNCEHGGYRLDLGLDDGDGNATAHDGQLASSEIDCTAYLCHGEDGEDGSDGGDGTNGLTALVSTSAEPDGGNCTNGGTRVDTGLDDNDNSTLDAGEIDATTYVCDGAAGSDGTNGNDGNDGTNGTNGLTALVSTSAEPDGGNCTNGGTRVDTGLEDRKSVV